MNEQSESPNATRRNVQGQEALAESQVNKLTTILRRLGVLILLISAVSFLVQGWSQWDSLTRFYYFLGFSTFLALTGILTEYLLKDEKGALAFLALSTTFIPIHFSELGAFTFSLTGKVPESFPSFLILMAESSSAVLTALAITVAICLPVAIFGFRKLAGHLAMQLAAVYLLGNLALLIPTREPEIILLIGALLLSINMFADTLYFGRSSLLATASGLSSRAMLFVPFLILLGRSSVYGYSHFLMSLVLGAIAAFMFAYLPKVFVNPESARAVRVSSLLPACLSWYHLLGGILLTSQSEFLFTYRVPITYLPMALVIFSLSFKAEKDGALFRRIAGFIAIGTVLYQLATVSGIGSAILCVAVSTFILSLSFAFEEKGLFYAGSFGLALGLIYHLKYATFLYELSPWVSLAVLGVVLMVVSSLLARYYRGLVQLITSFRSRLDTWE